MHKNYQTSHIFLNIIFFHNLHKKLLSYMCKMPPKLKQFSITQRPQEAHSIRGGSS